jgi:hypothetical protein
MCSTTLKKWVKDFPHTSIKRKENLGYAENENGYYM